VGKSHTPRKQSTIDDIQKRSAILFKITVAVLTVLLGGGLSLVTTLTSDMRALLLYGAAMVVGGLGALGGALVNWRTVFTRVRLLYYSQLIGLFGLVGFLLGSVAFLLLGPPPPSPAAEDVEPPTLEASAQAPPHQDAAGTFFSYEPANTIDGVPDTAWRVPGNGSGEWIKLDYGREVTVSKVGIIPGHDKVDPESGVDRFFQLYVVRRASIEFSDGTVKEKLFDRDRDLQWLQLDSPEVTTMVRIDIKDSYPPHDPPGADEPVEEAAISEIVVR
jgi:hypothetical protein